ncbi:MAG: hypothetical protein ABMA64_14230 [Myxococcota bacterium]
MAGFINEVDLEAAIRDARSQLDAFERSTSAQQLLARLQSASPLHPFLLLRSLSLIGTAFLVVAMMLALTLPFLYEPAAELIARLDSASGVPLFGVLAVLVVCSFGMALGGHFAAVTAARSATLMPNEAKIHQRLVSDLQQLEAQRAVSARLTPLSAEPRSRRR